MTELRTQLEETRGEQGTNSSARGCSSLSPGPLGPAQHRPSTGPGMTAAEKANPERPRPSIQNHSSPPVGQRRSRLPGWTRCPSLGSSGCPAAHLVRPDWDQAASILEGHRDSTLPASPKAPDGGSRVKADPKGGYLGLGSRTALGQWHCRSRKRPQDHKSHSGFGLLKNNMLRESVSSMLEINTRISEREGHVAQLCLYSTQSCHSAIS